MRGLIFKTYRKIIDSVKEKDFESDDLFVVLVLVKEDYLDFNEKT